jgi:hypothetical protein
VVLRAKGGGAAERISAPRPRIVAEVLIGLLAGDPLSYLNVQPTWKPTLPAANPGSFTLSDLVNIAVPKPEAPQPPRYPPQ